MFWGEGYGCIECKDHVIIIYSFQPIQCQVLCWVLTMTSLPYAVYNPAVLAIHVTITEMRTSSETYRVSWEWIIGARSLIWSMRAFTQMGVREWRLAGGWERPEDHVHKEVALFGDTEEPIYTGNEMAAIWSLAVFKEIIYYFFFLSLWVKIKRRATKAQRLPTVSLDKECKRGGDGPPWWWAVIMSVSVSEHAETQHPSPLVSHHTRGASVHKALEWYRGFPRASCWENGKFICWG